MGLHCYAFSTHADEVVLEPPLKNPGSAYEPPLRTPLMQSYPRPAWGVLLSPTEPRRAIQIAFSKAEKLSESLSFDLHLPRQWPRQGFCVNVYTSTVWQYFRKWIFVPNLYAIIAWLEIEMWRDNQELHTAVGELHGKLNHADLFPAVLDVISIARTLLVTMRPALPRDCLVLCEEWKRGCYQQYQVNACPVCVWSLAFPIKNQWRQGFVEAMIDRFKRDPSQTLAALIVSKWCKEMLLGKIKSQFVVWSKTMAKLLRKEITLLWKSAGSLLCISL